jgi:hypothetical protein
MPRLEIQTWFRPTWAARTVGAARDPEPLLPLAVARVAAGFVVSVPRQTSPE